MSLQGFISLKINILKMICKTVLEESDPSNPKNKMNMKMKASFKNLVTIGYFLLMYFGWNGFRIFGYTWVE